MKNNSEKRCKSCRWRDDFSHACFNGDSPNVADFMDDNGSCNAWEEQISVSIEEKYNELVSMCKDLAKRLTILEDKLTILRNNQSQTDLMRKWS